MLEALGAMIGLSPEQNQKCLEEVGVAFLFAQTHHGSMKYAGPVRAQLGGVSVFNILGPLGKSGYDKLYCTGCIRGRSSETYGGSHAESGCVKAGNDRVRG